MRKLTFILFALIAGSFAMQMNAAPCKAPARSAIYHSDQGFTRLGNTSIFYDISRRSASGPGYQYGISILGRVNNTTSYIYDYDYYSSTYENNGPGAGFIAAFQVNGGTADYLDARNGYGTTIDNVRMTARLEPQGDVAARVVYTLTNNNDQAVTVNAGVWGDIMIGDNDEAPLECMRNTYNGATYGIKMKYRDAENTPLLCALFGDHVTGVTAADTCWFGFYSSNWHPNEICGAYSSTIYPSTNNNWDSSYSQFYMIENGTYDSGLGFCWKDRTIEANSSIELSYLISVGEVDFLEPFNPDPDPEPDEPQPVFTYNIQAYDCEGWNNYGAPHPVKVWGEYVHAYGQNGYLEYQVDDENTWHTIGELISGAENGYEFDFNVSYNPNRTTDHVVAVRYNDGLGNTVPLEGLTWVDVRSYPVSQYINTYEYTGSPVSFVVNVNGEDIVIGANDEYINEGIYNVVVAEGAFAEGTIGVLSISFSISKPTAIDEISVNNEENGAWYTIDGRRISAPSQPGIYIRNGKKYIVK